MVCDDSLNQIDVFFSQFERHLLFPFNRRRATAPLDTGQLLVDPRKSFVERVADDGREELPPPALIGSGGR